MITTANMRTMDTKNNDKVLLIVRSLKRMPNNPDGKIEHVPTLSPSSSLFHDYLKWRDAGDWNKDTFERQYAPRFLREMRESPEAMGMLRSLVELSKTQDIQLVCYCQDESLCHRTLVKLILETMGGVVGWNAESRIFK